MTYLKWKNGRAYVYNSDGSYYGTYREYRFRRPCGGFQQLRKKGQMFTDAQVAFLHKVDRAARRWWNDRHPDRKC